MMRQKNDHSQTSRLTHIYGLDFGTSNTHLSVTTAGEIHPLVEDIHIEKTASIPSVVLYDERNFNCIAFGQSALEEWHNMNAKERKGLTLGSNFKQRLAFNKRAKVETELFFSALFESLTRQKLIPDIPLPERAVLTAGVPSKTVETHKRIMNETLENTTGQPPVLIEEPLGALFYHISRKDVTKEEARGGVLVIDFGGGTLDFAYLRDFKVQAVWGSPVIGGALFDDLFYTLFLRQNPGAGKQLEIQNLSGYIRTVHFKELKEKYSRMIANTQKENLVENIAFASTYFGDFKIGSVTELNERMSHYTPSKDYERDMAGIKDFSILFGKAPVNLYQLIEQTLLNGWKANKIKDDSISLVILTGGSSRWRFFVELINEHLPHTRILSSADPESTISRGLGLCYSATLYEQKVRKELRENKSELIERLSGKYKRIIDEGLDDYMERLFSVYRLVVTDEISTFFRNGGTIEELEVTIEQRLLTKQAFLEELNAHFSAYINTQVEEITKKELSKWFLRSRIRFKINNENNIVNAPQPHPLSEDTSGLSDAIHNRIATISSLTVGIISGSLLGGGGIALLATGPVGWVSGFVGGVILSAASLFGLKKSFNAGLKKIKIPGWLLKTMLLNEKMIINKAEKALKKRLEEKERALKQQAETMIKDNKKRIEGLIEEQIAEISYSHFIDF